MRYKDISREAVSDTYRRDQVESEKGKIRKIILGKGFFVQMGMNEPEPPEGFAAQRIRLKFRDEDTSGVTDNDMGDIPSPGDENTYLAVYFVGEFSEISCEFRAYQFSRYLSPINPFKRVQVTGFKSREISVDCWYLYPPIFLYVIFYHKFKHGRFVKIPGGLP